MTGDLFTGVTLTLHAYSYDGFHAEVTDVLDHDRLPGDPSARTAWVRCEASTALPYTVAVPLTGLRALAPNESRSAWRGHSRVHNPAPPTTKGTPA